MWLDAFQFNKIKKKKTIRAHSFQNGLNIVSEIGRRGTHIGT